jgi:formylglycine-generating enzyme required for sulfatase activity
VYLICLKTAVYDVSEGDWVWREYAKAVNNPVNEQLGQILDRLIESATKRRYQSVAEVLADLNPPLPSPKPTPPPPVPPTPAPVNPKPAIALETFSFEVVTIKLLESRGLLGTKTTVETNRSRSQAQYFKEDLGKGVILEMVAIPGGTFLMGSPTG